MKQNTNQSTDFKPIFKLLKPYRKKLTFAVFSVLLAAFFLYLGPFITSFILDYIISGNTSQLPGFLVTLLNKPGSREFCIEYIFIFGIAFFISTSLNGLFTYIRRSLVADISEGIAEDLRNQLYKHIQSLSFDKHKHINTGDYIQRCTSDVETVRKFISMQLMEIVRTVSMVIIALVIMFSVHTKMALISMSLLPVLACSSFIYFKYVKKYFSESDEAEGRLSSVIQENITGIRVVRAFGRQNDEVLKFETVNSDFRDKSYRLTRMLGLYWGCSDTLGYLQIALSLCIGIHFAASGQLSVGNVTLFTSYTGFLTWPVRQLGRILADLGKASVSMNRLNEILNSEPEKEPGRGMICDLHGPICFDHVSFGYTPDRMILNDLSFSVSPGETVGILGTTGSGKTSLIHLLQRLYTADSGSITINGTNINDIQAGYLRKNISLVLQEPFLYSKSIRENIGITRPGADIDEIERSAKLADIHDVILSFENGYDTIVGEKGVTLSGGQRQRVAIARSLMQNASVLIFDDSMSAVDAETDAKIRENLYNLNKDGITFIISHRITTLCKADKILVLENGCLTQQGSHTQLLKENGLYRHIAEIQDFQSTEQQ